MHDNDNNTSLADDSNCPVSLLLLFRSVCIANGNTCNCNCSTYLLCTFIFGKIHWSMCECVCTFQYVLVGWCVRIEIVCTHIGTRLQSRSLNLFLSFSLHRSHRQTVAALAWPCAYVWVCVLYAWTFGLLHVRNWSIWIERWWWQQHSQTFSQTYSPRNRLHVMDFGHSVFRLEIFRSRNK